MPFSADELIESSRRVTAQQMRGLILDVKQVLREERASGSFVSVRVLNGLATFPPKGFMTLVGDLHGDLESLSTILKESNVMDEFRKGEESFLVFLGDYGDRGEYSPEVYYVILALKQRFPNKVLMMRGNHESPLDVDFAPYDLPDQFVARLGRDGEEVHEMIRQLWGEFYYAAIVEGRYLILHGGIPTLANSVEEIANAKDLHPQKPHLIEILWNDPREHLSGTLPSSRGIGKFFGADVTSRMLQLTRTKTLIRGHEVCNGVKANHAGKVLTLFSSKAPYGLPVASFLKIRLDDEAVDANRLAAKATFV